MKFAIAFFLVVLITASSMGDDLPTGIPPDVQASLQANASLFSNLFIAGERNSRFLSAPDAVLKALQTAESEAEFTQKLRFELRFQGFRFRESIEYPPGIIPLHDQLVESSFDGTTFRLGFKRHKKLASTEVHIYDPAKAMEYARKHDSPKLFNKMEFWYLDETGFIGPQSIEEFGRPVESMVLHAADHRQVVSVTPAPGGNVKMLEVIIKEPEPWQSLETFVIEKHESYVSLNKDSASVQMQAERDRRELAGKHRLTRLWLNSDLGYAVEEKWVSRMETGEAMFYTRNSDFVQCGPDNVWMPKRCSVKSHAYWTAPLSISPDPLYETVIEMDQCKSDSFVEDQFRIWYDIPGAMVSDFRITTGIHDDAKVSYVPASLESLPKSPSFGRLHWLIMLNILFIAGWLGWLFLRFLKNRTEG